MRPVEQVASDQRQREMLPGNVPKARGRPPRSEGEIVRTKTWAEVVVWQSRLSLRKLDELCQTSGSGQWAKYYQGATSPTHGRLAQVERLFPGSRRLYDSPIWKFLDIETLGHHNPRELFAWLQKPHFDRYHRSEPVNGLFWRVEANIDRELRLILDAVLTYQAPFDVIGALLALTHESVVAQSQSDFVACVVAWNDISRRFEWDMKMSEGLWATVPEQHVRAFGDALLDFVDEDHPYFFDDTLIDPR